MIGVPGVTYPGEVLGPPPPTSLYRVQAAPKVSVSNNVAATIPFLIPPTVGNGIIVPVIAYRTTTPTCVDSYGNPYQLAVLKTAGQPTVFIFWCSYVGATGPGFAITIAGGASNSFYIATAIEVGNVGPYGLGLDQIASATASSTAAATGATPALTGPDVIVAGVVEYDTNQSFITVEGVTPPWLEEVESLPATILSGEIDSRTLLSVAGLTTSISWTSSPAITWVAALAAFRQLTAAPAARLSQDAIELLAQPTSVAAVVTQDAVELLSRYDVLQTQARVTQDAVEVLAVSPPVGTPARVTQDAIELLSRTTELRISQDVTELLSQSQIEARVSQSIIELLSPAPSGPTRVTQLPIEVFTGGPAPAHTTQVVVEAYIPVAVPTRVTQQVVEAFAGQSVLARVTQELLELWIVRGPCIEGDFPIDPAGSGTACASPIEPLDPDESGSACVRPFPLD